MTDRRRLFIALAISLVGCSGAHGQATKRVALLAYSTPTSGSRFAEALRDGLRALGWVEGRNLVFDIRWPEGIQARWEPLTAELLSLNPDVFVTTVDDQALLVAKAAPRTPVIFVVGQDPIEIGLVASLARPGGNITGIHAQGDELTGRQLALLKEVMPGLDKVGVFINGSARGRRGLQIAQAACSKLGLTAVAVTVDSLAQLEPSFENLAKEGVRAALEGWTGGILHVARDRLGPLSIQHRLAVLASSSLADSGVLLSYGANVVDLFRRAASLVDRVLRGSKPADIPIEQASVYDLAVNLRTARALGIHLPNSILLRATRVIE